MTILIVLGVWFLALALMLRFFQYVHDCDQQIRDLVVGRRSLFRKRDVKVMRVSARRV